MSKEQYNRRFRVPVTTETFYPITEAKRDVPNFQPIKTAFTAAPSSLKQCFLTVELQIEVLRCVIEEQIPLKHSTRR